MVSDETTEENAEKVAGANCRWRCPFRCRSLRRVSAVAQLSTFGAIITIWVMQYISFRLALC